MDPYAKNLFDFGVSLSRAQARYDAMTPNYVDVYRDCDLCKGRGTYKKLTDGRWYECDHCHGMGSVEVDENGVEK